MEEIEVAPGSAGEGQPIGDVRGGAIIVGVRDPSGQFQPQPPAETVLQAGDVVTALGTERTMERLEEAAGTLANGAAPRARPTLERPKKAGHGDYATNAALVLAPVVGAPPRDVAARLSDALSERLGPALDRIEVAGPGFLNLFLADAWYAAAVDWALDAGERFGALVA